MSEGPRPGWTLTRNRAVSAWLGMRYLPLVCSAERRAYRTRVGEHCAQRILDAVAHQSSIPRPCTGATSRLRGRAAGGGTGRVSVAQKTLGAERRNIRTLTIGARVGETGRQYNLPVSVATQTAQGRLAVPCAVVSSVTRRHFLRQLGVAVGGTTLLVA